MSRAFQLLKQLPDIGVIDSRYQTHWARLNTEARDFSERRMLPFQSLSQCQIDDFLERNSKTLLRFR